MRRVLMMLSAMSVLLVPAATTEAQTVAMTSALSGANETPGVTTGAFGAANVSWDATTKTLTWIIDVWNMPSGTTAAHFHVGGPGVAGPTVINITVPPQISNDFRLTGSATCTNLIVRGDQGIRSCEDFEQSLLGGQTYINIHSASNPGGEIRGQVVRVP